MALISGPDLRRWLWWAPLAVLTLCGALLSFRLGWIDVHLSESAAIEAYAARYARETSGTAQECYARPGANVWLVISCGRGEASRAYFVNRFGGLVAVEQPAANPPNANGVPST